MQDNGLSLGMIYHELFDFFEKPAYLFNDSLLNYVVWNTKVILGKVSHKGQT